MHSRIFQLSEEPLCPDDYATDFDLADMEKADYVICSDRQDDIAWLKECVLGIEFAEDNSYFRILSTLKFQL